MFDVMPILEELRQLVRSDGRADRRIAISAGIHPVTFSAFMSGRRGLSVDTAEKLATTLGRPLALAKPKKPAK